MAFDPVKSKFLGTSKWKRCIISDNGDFQCDIPDSPKPSTRNTAVELCCKSCSESFFYVMEEGKELPKLLFCPYCKRIAKGKL